MERNGAKCDDDSKESKVKRGKRKIKKEESSLKKGGCRFSNCNETGHRRVAWVSYDDQTTDDDAVFLSPRIYFSSLMIQLCSLNEIKPDSSNYKETLFHCATLRTVK